jgi:hypothetical protein
MKLRLGLNLAVLTASLSTLVSFQSKASLNCTEYLRRQGSFSFNRLETNDGNCILSVDPFNPPASFIYRSFLLGADGSLMVFNSYGTGEAPDQTGARVFYFFPRNTAPDVSLEANYSKAQSATSGLSIFLSLDQHRMAGMTGGDVIEASRVSPTNSGGVEFQNLKFLYLDAGFHLGEDPTGIPTATSKFIDTGKRSCSVKNSEIFKYVDQNPIFKFSDSELKVFLAKRCPSLKVNF